MIRLYKLRNEVYSYASLFSMWSEGEGTRLTTGFSTDFGMNPIGRLMGTFLMKGEMEKSLDYELKRLKEIAEAKPKFTIEISEENIQPISYVGQRTTMSIEDLGAIRAQMGKSFGDLMAVLGRAKESMTGAPMCLYPMYDEGQKKMEMICALPVNGDAKLPAKYAIQQTTGGKAAKGISMGAYSKLANAHEQINGYIAMKNLKRNGIPYEAYITDPMAEPDTTKWITEIYYPVK